MTTAKMHHYIPQFILKNWCRTHKMVINVFDKNTERDWKTSEKNIAGESHFYNHTDSGNPISLESNLANLEYMVSGTVNEIIRTESLGKLKDTERALMALFVAVQFSRSPRLRTQIGDLNIKLKGKMEKMYPHAKDSIQKQFSNVDHKLMSLHMISDSQEIAGHIMNKNWILLKDQNDSFYIGDSPVTLHNDERDGAYGNIGFAIKGIQIYLPISPSLTMAFMCPSVSEVFTRNSDISFDDARKFLGSEGVAGVRKAKEWKNSILGRGYVSSSVDNGIFLNHLQVKFANRFIFGGSDNFGLVRKMISDNPAFKSSATVSLI
jgi:hypothetical protein